MASVDPGLATATRPAEDPRIPHKDGSISGPGVQLSPSSSQEDKLRTEGDGNLASDEEPTAPDQFDPNFVTGRWELWSYYVRYFRTFEALKSVAGRRIFSS